MAPHRELDDAIEAILPLCAHFILQKPQGYDYHLGGKDNFEADRRATEEAIAIFPKTVESARSCRSYLSRVVRYLPAEAGSGR